MKRYDDLTFSDNFIFQKVLTNHKDICIKILEIILNKEIKEEIKLIENEQYIDILFENKSVRLDIYLEDSNNMYNIKMQNNILGELPKRSRYYQGVIDLNSIEKGKNYLDLKENKIIFICNNDLFGYNLPIYSFKNICAFPKNNIIELNDGTEKIFVNASSISTLDEIDEIIKDDIFSKYNKELPNLLDYIYNKNITNQLTKDIDIAVKESLNNNVWRNEYMTYVADLEVEKRKEGIIRCIEMSIELKNSKDQTINYITNKFNIDKEKALDFYEKVLYKR